MTVNFYSKLKLSRKICPCPQEKPLEHNYTHKQTARFNASNLNQTHKVVGDNHNTNQINKKLVWYPNRNEDRL